MPLQTCLLTLDDFMAILNNEVLSDDGIPQALRKSKHNHILHLEKFLLRLLVRERFMLMPKNIGNQLMVFQFLFPIQYIVFFHRGSPLPNTSVV